jgi:hypothetical protein
VYGDINDNVCHALLPSIVALIARSLFGSCE